MLPLMRALAPLFTFVLTVPLTALALSACRDTGPDPAKSPLARADDEPERALEVGFREPWDVPAIAARVARVRGLTLTRALRSEYVDGATMTREVADHFGARQVGSEPFWESFGLAAPGANLQASLRKQLGRATTGYYVRGEDRLALRETKRTTASDRVQRSATLVHEIEHAIQDQNGLLDFAKPSTADEMLAMRALDEGDAELTKYAVLAEQMLGVERPLSRLLHRARSLAPGDTEFDLRDAGAPPFARRMWRFPYRDGLSFVATLHRTGGFALVTRAFAHPPRSTEQVLHPEKYIAGELPVPVTRPPRADDLREVDGGRMGELRLSALLEECDTSSSKHAPHAEGWGGDSFAIVKDGEGNQSLLLATVWDDVASAERFEAALRARDQCLRAHPATTAPPPDAIIVRDRDRVAFVQGLSADAREGAARALLAGVGARPPAEPPLGAVVLVPLPRPTSMHTSGEFLRHGHVNGTKFESAPLGLTASVEGWTVQPRGDHDHAELMITRGNAVSAMRAAMYVAPHEADAPFVATYSRAAVALVKNGLGIELTYGGVSDKLTSFGTARVYEWSHHRGYELRLYFVPLCRGGATLVVLVSGGGLGFESEAEKWLATVHAKPDAPVCEWIAAERN
jgi:hypothetical protein